MSVQLGSNALRIVNRTVGDIRTPFAFQLTQGGNVVDLTGADVRVRMVADDGTTKIAETAVGVSVTDAKNGKGQYKFSADGVDTPGEYWLWVVVVSSGETSTFPVDGRRLQINLASAEGVS